MKIHNPNNLPLIDYRKVKPLQGELKDLNKANYAKLKGVLEARGFDIPLFLWKNGDDFYLLDGHQRTRVMKKEDMNDAGSYEVPYILVEAADEQEAKAKLLEITSQYGTISYESLYEFIATAELPEAEIYEAVQFDALPLLGHEQPEDKPEKEQKDPGLFIKIDFEDLMELENCLVEIQEVCENYVTKGIRVNDGKSKD